VTVNRVLLYDTTLRDGAQGEAISLSVEDKLKITRLVDRLGIPYVEGGWPGSNPKDAEYFRRVRDLNLTQTRVAAFGSTCRVGTSPQDDDGVQALLAAATPVVAVVGKSWTLHVRDVLRTTLDENLRIVRETVAHLKAHGRETILDAEHFFDGYRADPDYALATLRAAVEGGADTVVLCDTNGGSLPSDVERIVGAVLGQLLGIRVGIHTHNDGGLATANTLAAVNVGALHAQGTMNGYGERCGNANLCTLIPALELKMGLQVLPSGHLTHLTTVARSVAAIANQPLHRQAPYVGHSAFAHKGGIHVAAMRRNEYSYQHVNPHLVGNESRMLVSELSGRSSLVSKAEEAGIPHEKVGDLREVLQTIKQLEHRGFAFEAADASVEMLLHRARPEYQSPFEMVEYSVAVEHREGRGSFAEASTKVRVGDRMFHTAAEGNGPVDALYAALQKALLPVYPHMEGFQLVDYKVKILDGDRGTAATTRVLIDTQNSASSWTTVGASTNIIEASWLALADAVEYGLAVASGRRDGDDDWRGD
jgi:2-isopropylmalate synthase